MEKILLPVDGANQNTYAVDFACFLARLTRSRLTAVFFEGANGNNGSRKPLREPITLDEYVRDERTDDQADAAIRQFREACICRDVPSRIHRDHGVPIQELLTESRFADLIVLDPEAGFDKMASQRPGALIEQFMHAAECAVFVSPFSFKALETIYFAFDGSESSAFAIKQFTYLFPELNNRKLVIVSVIEDEGKEIPGIGLLSEWLKAHYQNIESISLQGNPADVLFSFLLEKKDAVVILGAYGRGNLSRVLIPSHARLLMKAVNLPLFIAHK